MTSHAGSSVKSADVWPLISLAAVLLGQPAGGGHAASATAASDRATRTAAPADINVASGEALAAAIQAAEPGSSIVLAPGDYPPLAINRTMVGPPVTISGPRAALVGGVTLNGAADGWILSSISAVQNRGPELAIAVQISAARNIKLLTVLIAEIRQMVISGSRTVITSEITQLPNLRS